MRISDWSSDVCSSDLMDRVLPVEDEEISGLAKKAFEKQGMKIHLGTNVTALKKAADSVTATLKDKAGKESQITVDRVILAVGIVGNIENIGLETTRVTVEKTNVVTDEWSRTAAPGIYAIGRPEERREGK